MKTNDMNNIDEIDQIADKEKGSGLSNSVRFIGMLALLALMAWLLSKLLG